METPLSPTELELAELYCHGLTDKEVADASGKPVWTVRTHKKKMHSKLGISTTHELVLYMVSRHNCIKWDVKELRRRGLGAILLSLFIFGLFTESKFDYVQNARTRTARVVRVRGRARTKNNEVNFC